MPFIFRTLHRRPRRRRVCEIRSASSVATRSVTGHAWPSVACSSVFTSECARPIITPATSSLPFSPVLRRLVSAGSRRRGVWLRPGRRSVSGEASGRTSDGRAVGALPGAPKHDRQLEAASAGGAEDNIRARVPVQHAPNPFCRTRLATNVDMLLQIPLGQLRHRGTARRPCRSRDCRRPSGFRKNMFLDAAGDPGGGHLFRVPCQVCVPRRRFHLWLAALPQPTSTKCNHTFSPQCYEQHPPANTAATAPPAADRTTTNKM